ncbi:MAG: F0F1 ATP synthase subunit A, partial [Gemmatimonadota bacterium]
PLIATLLTLLAAPVSGAADVGTPSIDPNSAGFAVVTTVQEHDVGQEHAAEQAASDHAEGHDEWGTEAMMHHIVDSREIEFFGWTWHLPEWESFHLGPLEIDMSPTKHTVFLWIAALLTILTMWIAARRFSRDEGVEEAPKGFLNFFEVFYVYLRDDVALSNIGRGGERFVPYVVTLFFFILYANLLGLVPYGATATSNIMVTGALAIISLVIVEAAGFAALGAKGYLGTIFYVPKGLPAWMVPIMLVIMTPVEIIGKLAKPFALAVRLFANMTAGHFVILALLGLILTYGGASVIGGFSVVGALALGLFVMFLEIFVAFLQAYIFTILTAVFIGLIRHAH